jgi:hypothetical protein
LQEKEMTNQQQRPSHAAHPAVTPGLRAQTALRAGATPSDDLLEATRHFLQTLLNALPTAASATATAPTAAAPTTAAQ